MVSDAGCLPHLQMYASSDASSQGREIESGNIGSREKGISLVSPSNEFSHHWSWFKLRSSLVIALNMYYILNSYTMQGAGCTKVFLVLVLKKFVIQCEEFSDRAVKEYAEGATYPNWQWHLCWILKDNWDSSTWKLGINTKRVAHTGGEAKESRARLWSCGQMIR